MTDYTDYKEQQALLYKNMDFVLAEHTRVISEIQVAMSEAVTEIKLKEKEISAKNDLIDLQQERLHKLALQMEWKDSYITKKELEIKKWKKKFLEKEEIGVDANFDYKYREKTDEEVASDEPCKWDGNIVVSHNSAIDDDEKLGISVSHRRDLDKIFEKYP